MIEPQLYTRNTHILPVQRIVTPGVRAQVQPVQNSTSTNVPVSVQATVYPSPPVVDNVLLAAQEALNTRRPQSYDVLPYQSSGGDSQTYAQTLAQTPDHPQAPGPGQANTPQNAGAQTLSPAAGLNASGTSTPSVPEFTRAQQAYTGAGAQDGRVFASSSPGETFYTGSRRTVDVIA